MVNFDFYHGYMYGYVYEITWNGIQFLVAMKIFEMSGMEIIMNDSTTKFFFIYKF